MEKQPKFHQLDIQSPYKPSLFGWKLYGNESSKKLESSYPGCKFPCWFASACASILLGVRIAAKWFFIPQVLRSILWWGELGSAARPAEYQCCVGSLSTAQNSIRNHIRPWSCSCRQREKNIGPGRCVQLRVKQAVCCSCFSSSSHSPSPEGLSLPVLHMKFQSTQITQTSINPQSKSANVQPGWS